MCAIMSWGAHEYFMHPIFVLKNGCDIAFEIEGRKYLVTLVVLPGLGIDVILGMN
jgi:hypothetical protein